MQEGESTVGFNFSGQVRTGGRNLGDTSEWIIIKALSWDEIIKRLHSQFVRCVLST